MDRKVSGKIERKSRVRQFRGIFEEKSNGKNWSKKTKLE